MNSIYDSNTGSLIDAFQSSKLFINGASITNNRSNSKGVIIISNYSYIEMIDSVADGNFNSNDGGVFYVVENSSFKLTKVRLSNNTTESNGSAIYLSKSSTE